MRYGASRSCRTASSSSGARSFPTVAICSVGSEKRGNRPGSLVLMDMPKLVRDKTVGDLAVKNVDATPQGDAACVRPNEAGFLCKPAKLRIRVLGHLLDDPDPDAIWISDSQARYLQIQGKPVPPLKPLDFECINRNITALVNLKQWWLPHIRGGRQNRRAYGP